MHYECEIRSSIDELDLGAWTALAGDDPFMDPRFVRAVERGQAEVGKFWSLIVRDVDRRPVATACLSLLPLDLAIFSDGTVKSATTTVRKLLPNALKYPAVFCGLPVSAGQQHLRLARPTDTSAVVKVLVQQMQSLARQHRARFLIFKEFESADCPEVRALREAGFFVGESPPMNHFPCEFKSFDEYRAALKAPYRSKIVRSQRKFTELGLRVECLKGGAALVERLNNEAYGMYLAVVEKSSIRLEVLSLNWFREMAQQFEEESVWTAVYQQKKLLAWAYGLRAGGIYHSLFGGVDYSQNAETDAYFNLMYQELDLALCRGAKDIQLGQTADDFKSRLGAMQSKRFFLVKPLRWKARMVLNLAADRVLPTYPPPVARHVFHAHR